MRLPRSLALRTAANAAYAEMRGEKAFDLLQKAFVRASAAGDNRIAAIVQADAAALAGRCPALFTTPLSREEILALIDQAKDLAPAGDLEVATHIALASAWDGARGPTVPTDAQAREALERTAEFGDPTLISSALDAAGGRRQPRWAFQGGVAVLVGAAPAARPAAAP